jgi:hypothetical protein
VNVRFTVSCAPAFSEVPAVLGSLRQLSSLAVCQERREKWRWAINLWRRQAVRPCILAAEFNGPFKCLSIAVLQIRLAKQTSEGVLLPSILLLIFLAAYYLLFSSTEPGHVSQPVLLVSAPRILLQLERETAALSREF